MNLTRSYGKRLGKNIFVTENLLHRFMIYQTLCYHMVQKRQVAAGEAATTFLAQRF